MVERGDNVITVFFDYQKAFDSVPHQRLLSKLDTFGLKGNIKNWIRSYLTDRKQRVCINGSNSEWSNVSSGVPQGSVLGPLLFVLYINDLPMVTDCVVKLFADDTKLYGPAKTIEDCQKIQNDIDRMVEWSKRWQLRFHPDKCKILKIGDGHVEYDFQLGGAALSETQQEKDLGVIMDSTLTFKQHMADKIAKANQVASMIRRSFHHLDVKMLADLFKSRVRPVLEYATSIWQPFLKADIINMEKVQRRATKLVGAIKNLPYSERLKTLRLPSLEYRRRRGRMIEVYKILHHHYKTNFPWLILDPSGRTRGHTLKLLKPRRKTKMKSQAFSTTVINDWNSLPENVVMAPTMNAFKNCLDKFWKDKIYSYTEYGTVNQ